MVRSYNAYLIKTDEGVIIVDTVKKEFQDEFFLHVEALCSYDAIKYVIIHHIEPDHSGALPELIRKSATRQSAYLAPSHDDAQSADQHRRDQL